MGSIVKHLYSGQKNNIMTQCINIPWVDRYIKFCIQSVVGYYDKMLILTIKIDTGASLASLPENLHNRRIKKKVWNKTWLIIELMGGSSHSASSHSLVTGQFYIMK